MKHPIHWSLTIGAALLCSTAHGQVLQEKALGVKADSSLGWSVAIDGDHAVAGAPEVHASGEAGTVYRYDWVAGSPGHWSMNQKGNFCGSDGVPDLFGVSVDISGSTIVVGAPMANCSTSWFSGAAYVISSTGTFYDLTASLTPGDNASFGEAVAIDSDESHVAVGAPGESQGGKVYVFAKVAATFGISWRTLAAPAWTYAQAFGSSVAMSNGRLVVGDPYYDWSGSGMGTGRVFTFVYNSSTGDWDYEQTLYSATGGWFGKSVAIDGSVLIVGAEAEEAAYIYRRKLVSVSPLTFSWVLQSRLESPDAPATTYFGRSVAIDGLRAVVGASNGGGVHVYRCNNVLSNVWERAERFLPENIGTAAPELSMFGNSVAISGDTVLVGGPMDDDPTGVIPDDAGAAYFFTSPADAWAYGFGTSGNCPCGNDDPYAGCVNSTGQGGLLTVEGSASVAADDLEFHAAQLPASKACLMLLGGDTASVQIGNGTRAVGAGTLGLFRLPKGGTTTVGTYSLGPDLSGYPKFANNVSAGETWNFQLWYRDGGGPCGGSQNYTNAMQIDFLP